MQGGIVGNIFYVDIYHNGKQILKEGRQTEKKKAFSVHKK